MKEINSEKYYKDLSKAMGFYTFNSPRMNVASEESHTSVNGNWKPIQFGFVDDEYDTFVGKKARERRKIRKELKDQGVKYKDRRKQALEEVGRTKIGEKLSSGLNKVAKGVVVVTLATPRASFLSLLRLNFRGLAYKLYNAQSQSRYANVWKKVKEKWEKLGGKLVSLERGISAGKNKKPLFCGARCKGKLVKYTKKGFDGSYFIDTEKLNRDIHDSLENNENYDHFTGFDDITIAGWVAMGSSVVGAITGVVASVKTNKRQDAELQLQKDIANKELDLLSDAQKKQIALAEKQITNELDPRNQILNNPDLTNQEKQASIKLLDDTLQTKSKRDIKKYIIYGAIGLVGIFVLIKILGKKGKTN